MTEAGPFEGDPVDSDRALYRLWRDRPAATVAAPPALLLAAYAEGRLLEEAELDLVEAALAADPELLDAILAARRPVAPEIVSAKLLRGAQGLVLPIGNVVPFRPRSPAPAARMRQNLLAWAGVAASLALISTVGFNLGFELEQTMNAAPMGTQIDLLDQMSGGGVG